MILLLALCAQACGLVDKKPIYRIAFSQCVGDDAWRQTMLEEMRRELSFYPDVEFIYRDANNSSDRQIQQLHELLGMEPDLIIVSPNEAEPLTPVVDEIFRSGIPVIVTDRKTSSGLYHAYVGADNYEVGFLAGQYLANKLQGKGVISEVTGLPGSSAAIERQKGFHAALKPFPHVVLHEYINGRWLIDEARAQVEQRIDALAASDAIFAYNDQMALGTYQALQEAIPDNDIKIVGVDALPGDRNGLQFVADRMLDASMLYPTGGKECIQTAMAILQDRPYQRENILGSLVVDSANVQLMKLQADKIIDQQADIDEQQQLFAEQQRIFSNQQRVLNILVVSLVLAIVFAGISFYSLKANWDKNKQLEHQNQEILGQQQRILEMTKAVEEATEAKINFFTNISHEFKTPLSLMVVPIEELLGNAKLPESTHRSLRLIKKNALILQHLVSQLIDLRRVGYEKLQLKAKEGNITLFCSHIVQSFRPLAQRKSINFRLESDLRHALLWFDEDLMEKLLYNLLSNAFKFTPASGEIVLRLRELPVEHNEIEIQVTDTGEGIADADIAHLFEPFYQGENHVRGTGIGLSLCKEITALHHGHIAVQSQQGQGTTVTVALPRGHGHLQAEEKTAAQPTTDTAVDVDQCETASHLSLLTHGMEAGEPTPMPENPADSSPVKEHSILIVEDHPDMRQFLAEKMSAHFTVYTAAHARAGFDMAHEQLPDLIISDVLMPGELGTALAEKLKADIRTATIPIILLTARGTDEQVATGLSTLADAYVTKPFNMDHLIAQVNNLLENRRLLHRHYSCDVAEFQPVSNLSVIDRRFLNELAALVEENIANSEMNVDYLCEQLALSRIQLYRKVKSLLDCSVNDYIAARRLRKAAVLLQQGEAINSVAYQTGFSSPAYFSTAFKNKYGASPSSFKKNVAAAR